MEAPQTQKQPFPRILRRLLQKSQERERKQQGMGTLSLERSHQVASNWLARVSAVRVTSQEGTLLPQPKCWTVTALP